MNLVQYHMLKIKYLWHPLKITGRYLKKEIMIQKKNTTQRKQHLNDAKIVWSNLWYEIFQNWSCYINMRLLPATFFLLLFPELISRIKLCLQYLLLRLSSFIRWKVWIFYTIYLFTLLFQYQGIRNRFLFQITRE